MQDAAHDGRYGLRDDASLTILYDSGLRRAELAQVDRAMLDIDEGRGSQRHREARGQPG